MHYVMCLDGGALHAERSGPKMFLLSGSWSIAQVRQTSQEVLQMFLKFGILLVLVSIAAVTYRVDKRDSLRECTMPFIEPFDEQAHGICLGVHWQENYAMQAAVFLVSLRSSNSLQSTAIHCCS